MDASSKARRLAPIVLRFGLVILFLWFGLSQITDPAGWTSWLPSWTLNLPVAGTTLVLLNCVFEVALGVALAAGFWTRIVAALLALHLFFIAYELGYNDIGVRDFCLAIATSAIALFGPDVYSLDEMRSRSRTHA